MLVSARLGRKTVKMLLWSKYFGILQKGVGSRAVFRTLSNMYDEKMYDDMYYDIYYENS